MQRTKKLIFMLLMLAASIGGFAQNTQCAGIATGMSQGSGLPSYRYAFTTVGTSVTVEFEVLSPLTGLVGYAWTFNPGFAENQMTNVSGQIFRRTYTNQTVGSTFTVQAKFAWAAGGFAVT